MSSINDVTILGRLGADPDVRYTQNNKAVANLSVATSQRYKNPKGEYEELTEWHRVVLWGKRAEIAQRYLEKGKQCCIKGSLQTRKWEDRDGVTRYTTEIVGRELVLLGSAANRADAGQSRAAAEAGAPQDGSAGAGNEAAAPRDKSAGAGTHSAGGGDDDLPF